MDKLNGSNLVVPVQGKLIAVEEHQGKRGMIYRNIIREPAKDEFSHPNTVCVISRSRLGDVNAVVECKAKVSGRTNRTSNRTFYNHELWAQ